MSVFLHHSRLIKIPCPLEISRQSSIPYTTKRYRMPQAGTLTKQGYSVDDLARELSLSKSFLRNEIRQGALRATLFGRRLVVLRKDLDAYLAAKKTAA